MNREDINGKLFLDDEANEWQTYSEAGTGEYYWWAINIDTEEKKEFSTEYVIQKIMSYNKDKEYFKNKEQIEANMYNLIKRMSNDILRKELLKNEDWSNNDINLLNILMKGNFDIKVNRKIILKG